ncbi:TIGR03826 family flagellar region protein [Paenibacillus sp. 1P07SE]|uniref:TIGR03826 family flagellar region protein n=1 Tax=Paenibacillus sp. 1P07SE TaxID=3132209 RepID=UPI0039A41B9F
MNLGNCPRCGRLYAVNFREVCPSCIKEIDKEYESCASYLRENRGCGIQELSEETGVSYRQITKFIREGRISLIDAPNLAYPCEMCGSFIREGHMCNDCRAKLIKDFGSASEAAASAAEQQRHQAAYKISDKTRKE